MYQQHWLYQASRLLCSSGGESFTSFSCEYLFLPWRKTDDKATCNLIPHTKLHASHEMRGDINLMDYLSLYGAWLSHSRMKNCAQNETLTIMYGVWRAVCVASDQKQFNKGRFNGGLKPCYFSSGSRVLIDPISAALLIFVARGHVICTYQSRNKSRLPDKILQLQIRHS